MIGERRTPPGYAAQEFRLKMISPVYIGDTIKITVTISELDVDGRKVLMMTEIYTADRLCAVGDTTIKFLRPVDG